MKTRKLKTVLLAITTILLTACGGDNNETPAPIPTPEPKVYVAGHQKNSSGIFVATLWIDGVAQNITDGTKNSFVSSIYVDGDDVYITGRENSVSKVWKNGVATDYTDARELTSVFVHQNNVYVTGYDYSNNRISIAKVWKNNVATNLTDPITSTGKAEDVFVKNNDIYVVVENYDINTDNTYVTVWKNGVTTNLNATGYGSPKAIFVDNEDVYVAGNTGDNNSFVKGKIWKNGTATELTGITHSNTTVRDVFVYKNDVYAIGTDGAEDMDASQIPTLWKNGVPTHLSYSSNSLFVHNNTTYLAGYELNSDNVDVAKLWVNGEETALSDGTNLAYAIAVFVK